MCEVGELVDIFSDAGSLDAFLTRIVTLVSQHMLSPVCSIYLYREGTKDLVLRANVGLSPDSVGKVTLKLGEGLTGLALKEMRPIRVKRASRDRHYRFFPGIGEENYESFLAVPLTRGLQRIGVIVAQNSLKDFFDENDVRVLKAITSQLSSTVETAKLLMGGKESPSLKTKKNRWTEHCFIKGEVGAAGVALGPARILREGRWDVSALGAKRTGLTLGDLLRAVKESKKQLEDLQAVLEKECADVATLIFSAQILMLKDTAFIGAMENAARDGMTPSRAVIHVVNDYSRRFRQIPDEYLKERYHDVEDVGARILRNLAGEKGAVRQDDDNIVIAGQLRPTDIFKLFSSGTKGVILLSGGVTSHVAILSRSLGLPLIIADEPDLLAVPEGTEVLLDGEAGNVYIRPEKNIVATFQQRARALAGAEQAQGTDFPELKSRDGTRVRLLANINLLSDAKVAARLGAQGVGLYRTEFPFLIRGDFPGEEEQYLVYKKLIDNLPGQEVNFRTLDIGGDKVLSYYQFGKEQNPFLGMRSIRFSLTHQEIFKDQLRAILRAGAGRLVKIMFPMISSLDEFRQARQIVLACRDELVQQQIPVAAPQIGLMIEIPSVLEIIDDLAREADFFSVGTNDLIQYMLAVDRTNEKVADLYLPHHPAILRGLHRIVRAAERAGIDVSVCGDMAQDERYLPFLLGIGVRIFSVDAMYLTRIRRNIEKVDLSAAREEAGDLLGDPLIRGLKKSFLI